MEPAGPDVLLDEIKIVQQPFAGRGDSTVFRFH